MRRRTWFPLSLGLAVGLGCTSSDAGKDGATKDGAKSDEKADASSEKKTDENGAGQSPGVEPEPGADGGADAPEEATPPPAPPPVEEPGEATQGGWPAPRPLAAVAATKTQTPLSPVWTEAHTDAGKKLSLETGLSGGVLLRVDGAPHALQEDGTFAPVPAADAESPSALKYAPEIAGFWPKNAWRVSERELDDKALRKHDLPEEWGEMGIPPTWFRFHTFRGNNRWVGQTVGTHSGPDDYTVEEPGGVTEPELEEHVVWTASPRRGLIVAKGTPPNDEEKTPLLHFERVGGGDAPESMEYQDGYPLGLYETKGGQVFLFLADFGHVVVQRSCAPSKDPAECAAQSRVALPAADYGGSWRLVAAAHRHRKSASFGLRAKHQESKETREFLLHYETGGFKLEVPPDAAQLRQVLSAEDGGLWIVLGNHLWHRDDAAQWARVTLPPALADAAEIQIAKDRSDPRRLWISGNTQVVLTTPADLPAAN